MGALKSKGITPRIPGRESRTEPIRNDNCRYRRSYSIEITFGGLKDRRRVQLAIDTRMIG